MRKKSIALAVIHDGKGNILMQNRKTMSKFGEEYGYFGGGIEEGETPEEAVRREIKEELDFDLKEIRYLGKYVSIGEKIREPLGEVEITWEVFVSKITKEEYETMTCLEGDGMGWIAMDKIVNLKMAPIPLKILEDFKQL